jgi:enamine deaminase RidA (YjgF/YER057c/UK114 family)
MNIQRHRTNALMSQIVIRADTVYLCGQIADDASADIQGQTRQILQKLDSLLSEAGSGRDKLLMATLWLASMADFAAMNREWEAWLPAGAAPARATVQATLFTPAHKIEIAVIAAR